MTDTVLRSLTVRVTNYWLVRSWEEPSFGEYVRGHPGTEKITLTNGMYIVLPCAFMSAVEMEGWGAVRGGMLSKTPAGWDLLPKSDGPCSWGYDARGRGLVPFRSMAVDPDLIKLGTHWRSDWAGKVMTPAGPWDGLLDAVDVGEMIDATPGEPDYHIDLFVGDIGDRVDEHYAPGMHTPKPWTMTLSQVG